MQKTAATFVGLACCILCLSEQSIAYLASPRAMLVYVLALWLRCEWLCVQNRGSEETESRNKTVKENYELSQTVMNLSDQHKMLCDIRNTALKSLRYSKDTFAELCFPSGRSYTSSSQSPCVSTPESKPDSSAETRQVSPLGRPVDPVLRSRTAFRRGSMSETNVSMHGGKRTEEP
jgi:hypothetical protein